MKRNLTTKFLDSLKPREKRLEVRDQLLPGFGIRITPRGRKTFFVSTRHLRRKRRVALGRYPLIGLADARAKAREVLADPEIYFTALEEKQSRLTVKEAFDLFIELYAKKRNKDWRGVETRLEKDFVERYPERYPSAFAPR